MKDKTLPKLRQDWLIEKMKILKLENPVSEVVAKTGYSKGSVSNFLSKARFPTVEFLNTFCEQYGYDYEEVKKELEEKRDKMVREQEQEQQQGNDNTPTEEELRTYQKVGDYSDDIGGYLAQHYTPVGLGALYVLARAYATPMDKMDIAKMKAAQRDRIKLIYSDIELIYEMDIDKTQEVPLKKTA